TEWNLLFTVPYDPLTFPHKLLVRKNSKIRKYPKNCFINEHEELKKRIDVLEALLNIEVHEVKKERITLYSQIIGVDLLDDGLYFGFEEEYIKSDYLTSNFHKLWLRRASSSFLTILKSRNN
ncbi:5041_t:CDS:2, partial [Scutellospora calospora]